MDTCPKELKTKAYVLRRTNYAEADRILNIITPLGKFAVMAKGIRKAKSKLAGSVEMFTLSEINLHFGKGDMATLVGAKMIKFDAEILKDLDKMEVASGFLKDVNKASEMINNPEFFEILDKGLTAINDGINLDLSRSWFLFNLARASGEQINLYTDTDGKKLEENECYIWNSQEMGLQKNEAGLIDANVIKIMRLMWTTDLMVVSRVKDVEKFLPEILKIAQAVKR